MNNLILQFSSLASYFFWCQFWLFFPSLALLEILSEIIKFTVISDFAFEIYSFFNIPLFSLLGSFVLVLQKNNNNNKDNKNHVSNNEYCSSYEQSES